MNESSNSLSDLRNEILEVTLKIFYLCEKRLKLAKQIAELKSRKGFPLENLVVEEKLRLETRKLCEEKGLGTMFCEKVLDLLIEESKKVQESLQSQK